MVILIFVRELMYVYLFWNIDKGYDNILNLFYIELYNGYKNFLVMCVFEYGCMDFLNIGIVLYCFIKCIFLNCYRFE